MTFDLDGNAVASDSESFRHACEVRHVARMSDAQRINFCKLVRQHRGGGGLVGRAAAVKLWRAALQWSRDERQAA